jgi:UDP-N-acetylglucosamine:LPS N-acetylglucosamine transferase
MANDTSRRILAIASEGGHWQQLMQIKPAFEGHRAHYLTTLPGLAAQSGLEAHETGLVPDCNRDARLKILLCAAKLAVAIIRHRPHVVISTGALPGVIALGLGRLIGARTIWLDSIANGEEMSMSGRHARRVAHLWLSQWPHVAEAEGATYAGAIL